MNTVDVRAKLAELGLELPVAAKPVAAYVPAIRTGNLVFTAGQLPLANGEMAGVGKVDGAITPERAKELAQVIPAPGTGEQLVAYMKRALA